MIVNNCPNFAVTPSQTPLFSFQPLDCGYFYDQCGEKVDCPPLDAVIDKVNGGFVKSNWVRHVIFFLLNSDAQDQSCTSLGARRGAASDGFTDSIKHGNTLWSNKKISTSREAIKDYVAIVKSDLTAKFKYLGLNLNLKVDYKMTGAFSYILNISIDDNNYILTRDTRKPYFEWAK